MILCDQPCWRCADTEWPFFLHISACQLKQKCVSVRGRTTEHLTFEEGGVWMIWFG